jgi:hypothetical protein
VPHSPGAPQSSGATSFAFLRIGVPASFAGGAGRVGCTPSESHNHPRNPSSVHPSAGRPQSPGAPSFAFLRRVGCTPSESQNHPCNPFKQCSSFCRPPTEPGCPILRASCEGWDVNRPNHRITHAIHSSGARPSAQPHAQNQ